MRKLTLSILAAALVVASTPAFADQPTPGAVAPNTNNGNGSNGNSEGQGASALIQNGQLVRGQAQSGQRSDLVHGMPDFPGLGGSK